MTETTKNLTEALAILKTARLACFATDQVAWTWLAHAANHLERQLDAYLRSEAL